MVKKFEVFWCEMKGVQRPCLVVSPNELNAALPYVMIAPITEIERAYPFRVGIRLKGKQGQIALDMIQTVDVDELGEKMGMLPPASHAEVNTLLRQVFE